MLRCTMSPLPDILADVHNDIFCRACMCMTTIQGHIFDGHAWLQVFTSCARVHV